MAIINRSYVGDVGTLITVNTKEDITTATKIALRVKKPDGTEVEWPGMLHNVQYIQYIVDPGDFSVAGKYLLQAYVELPTWQGLGETASFRVYDRFEE